MMESVGKRMCPSKKITVKFVRKSPAVKKAKDYLKEYRERLKSDPGLYKLHRAVETLRIKKNRERNQSENAKQRNKELQRFRQKRYRERLKMQGKLENKWKPMTRKTCEEQRRKWGEKYKERK